MSINVDFLFVDQQMQKLFQHQSANRTSSSSTKLSHPICTTSVICIILVQHAHLHSLCISSTIPIISDQHALLILPKCTIQLQHTQHCHTFSTTLVQHAQLQYKCTPDPHRIIQSNCTTQLRHQSNSKIKEEKDGHIRDTECFQECI